MAPQELTLPGHVKALVGSGALVVVNHSGGKDSQAMYALLRDLAIDATRWSLDTAKVKHEMGEDWFSTRCRITPTVSLRHIPVVTPALAVA